MKALLISLLFLFTSGDYCDGFDAGWEAGYCYQEGEWCVAPVPPACPIPTVYEDDTYEDGYNRGFVMGKNERDND